MNLAGFEKIAPHLSNPLVLVGFVMLLFYGIHRGLMKSGLLRQVTQKDSGLIIRLFLRYGFWLALTLLVAGFGLAGWSKYVDKVQPVDAAKLAAKLLEPLQGQLQFKDEQIKALTEAITALSKADAPATCINDALQALEQGNTKQAKAIFAEVLKTKEAAGAAANKEAAAAARHLGALAFMNDTKAALAAYEKAVQLDPDNPVGLNMLGRLLRRTGKLDEAEEILKKAVKINQNFACEEGTACAKINLANLHRTRGELDKAEQLARDVLEERQLVGDKKMIALAYGMLGNVYQVRGELDQAEEMHRKALAIHKALGSKEGLAINYGNLGEVYRIRGNMEQAKRMYKKSLEISEALSLKEVTATQYSNLALVYDTRGELDRAEEMHRKALELAEALGDKEGMVVNYGNLGSIYKRRGEPDKAKQMYQKGLEISEASDLKEATAVIYCNLGIMYAEHGELDKAEDLWRKGLNLLQAMGHRDAKKVQQALDDLAQHRTNQ